MVLSDDLQTLVRPFSGYRALIADQDEDGGGLWLMLRRPALWLLIAAVFLSLSTAGRLVWFHLLLSAVGWWVVVAIQLGLIGLFHLTGPRRCSLARMADLYFIGQTPYLLLLLLGAAVCIFVPDVFDTYIWLSRRGVVLGLVGLAAAWSILLTVGWFEAVVGNSRARAIGMTVVFYLLYGLCVLATHWALDQLQPLLFGPR